MKKGLKVGDIITLTDNQDLIKKSVLPSTYAGDEFRIEELLEDGFKGRLIRRAQASGQDIIAIIGGDWYIKYECIKGYNMKQKIQYIVGMLK